MLCVLVLKDTAEKDIEGKSIVVGKGIYLAANQDLNSGFVTIRL